MTQSTDVPEPPAGDTRLAEVLRRIDAANAEDPNAIEAGGKREPKELVHGRLVDAWVRRLVPDASPALRIAARGHHFRRWELPRSDYPMNRAGYLRWRAEQKRLHARGVATILRAAEYDEATIARVGEIIERTKLGSDPEAQALEDAICLVFLETQFLAFFHGREDVDEAKMIGILRKTWRKMSDAGRERALALDLPEEARALVERALGGTG